jgi:hypothetical protein
MSETTGEIQAHIRDAREDLNANLNELGEKVKSATDWRQHFRKSPGMFLAAALGGGVVLALATTGRRSRPIPAPIAQADVPTARRGGGGPLDASIGIIKGALIGLAATRAKKALAQLIPGFEAEVAEREKPVQRPAENPERAAAANGGAAGEAPRV